MKTVKMTVLFKSGVEKIYIFNVSNEDEVTTIKSFLFGGVGHDKDGGCISLDKRGITIAYCEIASVEIEVLE